MANCIKEQFHLCAGRASAETMRCLETPDTETVYADSRLRFVEHVQEYRHTKTCQ
jgi:hypothetical protein